MRDIKIYSSYFLCSILLMFSASASLQLNTKIWSSPGLITSKLTNSAQIMVWYMHDGSRDNIPGGTTYIETSLDNKIAIPSSSTPLVGNSLMEIDSAYRLGREERTLYPTKTYLNIKQRKVKGCIIETPGGLQPIVGNIEYSFASVMDTLTPQKKIISAKSMYRDIKVCSQAQDEIGLSFDKIINGNLLHIKIFRYDKNGKQDPFYRDMYLPIFK